MRFDTVGTFVLSQLLVLGITSTYALAQSGVVGSSEGSSGMTDDDATALKAVQQSKLKGASSAAYIGSLVDLGMHYNRQGQYLKAQKSLVQALAIVDKGALKPTKGSVQEKSPVVIEHSNGTVSATVVKPFSPYEDVLEQLLPALVEADLNSNHLAEGETHVKRLIIMAESNRIHRIPALMFAYNQYSELLTKMHRTKEAEHYKAEAAKINASIKPL